MIDCTKATREEYDLFSLIADREEKEGVSCYTDRISMIMDIQAAHATCPLKLQELLKAPSFDFLHDIYGIAGNLNRDTGEIENCFLLRYAL